MTLHYYYIKVNEHIRCERAKGPRDACKLAFGVIYDDGEALYKDVGTRSPKYLSAKLKVELQGPDGWLPIPKAKSL